MEFKEKMLEYKKKLSTLWKTGKIQRSSRVTYDVVWNVILFFLVIGFIGILFAGAVGAGYFASLVKDEPIRSYETMSQDIYDYSETSKLFFANDVYFGDINAEIQREETSLENISPILTQAVIATEDEYFNEHQGIVPKAILRAMVQEVTNSSVQTGGSTLTQQLIKNQILSDEVSFERKAVEMLLALRLERFFEKDEILEAYLNIVPYGRDSSGRNIAGVQTAAQGIFGVNADEVNLPQAAYLAGLPQSPSAYTPFVNSGGLKDEAGIQPGLNRMQTVLYRMYDMEYITREEYEDALEYDIVADFIEKKASPRETYPVLTFEIEERASKIIKRILAEEDGYTSEDLNKNEALNTEYEELAARALRNNGYEIHSTIDKDIYDVFQEIGKNYAHYGRDHTFTVTNDETGETTTWTEEIQAAGMLIENSSGRIISFFGNREPSLDNHYNYATRAVRSNGSTIKPILDYAPALEKGVVQPGTPIADYPRTFPNPGGEPYKVGNYGGGSYGMVSARRALASSYNIPAVDTYMKIIQDNPAKEYLEKMGITTLTSGDHTQPSLSLGAMDRGVTVEENINAFSTLGNHGNFSDGYMIEKIVTNDGKVLYEHEAEPVEVFSPQTSYLTFDMMRDVISSGTGTYLNSQLKHGGVDWAGKTGTSGDYKDAWFVAVNPNVTFGTWIGYKTPASVYDTGNSLSYSQRNIKLWADFINAASDINPDLVAPKEKYKRPDGIVERSYCSISGMLPSDLCEKAGLVKTDLFNAKFVPTEKDDSLISGNQVNINGKSVKAGSNTPSEFTNGNGVTFNPDWLKRNGFDKLNDLSVLYPRGADGEKWKNIGIPSGSAGSSIKDDGKAPGSPTSVKKSGSKLTWNKPGNNDVVGYRIYHANSSGGDFKLMGNSSKTEYNIGNEDAVYMVKAVDYFGNESKASSEVNVGDKPKDDDNDESKDSKADDEKAKAKEDDKDKKDDKPEEKNKKSNENNNGNNDNGNKKNDEDDDD